MSRTGNPSKKSPISSWFWNEFSCNWYFWKIWEWRKKERGKHHKNLRYSPPKIFLIQYLLWIRRVSSRTTLPSRTPPLPFREAEHFYVFFSIGNKGAPRTSPPFIFGKNAGRGCSRRNPPDAFVSWKIIFGCLKSKFFVFVRYTVKNYQKNTFFLKASEERVIYAFLKILPRVI